ncbi:hypothetical protein Tco_0155865 [Tanacetum coccineum]
MSDSTAGMSDLDDIDDMEMIMQQLRSIRMSKLNFKEDEEASGEDKDEEEEHLAPADSVALPAIDPIPLAEETKPFEKDKARKTVRLQPPMAASIKPLNAEFASAPTPPSPPPPSPLLPWSSPLPQIPSPPILVLSPPLPLPSPPTHTSPTFIDAPLGYKAAMIQSRATSPPPVPSPPLLLPFVDRRSDIPETNMPFWKRLCLTALDSRILWIRRIDLVSFVVFSEVQAQIRRIFLNGYGVLGVRTIIFKYLRLSSRMRAF